jgi:hypothetical protein
VIDKVGQPAKSQSVEGVENVLVRMFQSSMKYEENSGDY